MLKDFYLRCKTTEEKALFSSLLQKRKKILRKFISYAMPRFCSHHATHEIEIKKKKKTPRGIPEVVETVPFVNQFAVTVP
jgi:hypothetical protein